jgi:hypothetical protein
VPCCQHAGLELGAAKDFVILAGTEITSTGAPSITGKIGLSPGTAITDTAPGMTVNTKILAMATEAGDVLTASAADAAKAALLTAYTTVAGLTPAVPLGLVKIIGTETLTPGVYNAPSSLAIDTRLSLDAGGDPSARWIFQIGSTLVVTGKVVLLNGARAQNVFWQVGSSATLMGDSLTVGTVMAQDSITSAAGGAEVDGRLFAITAAVTFTGVRRVGFFNPEAGTYNCRGTCKVSQH